MSEAFVGEIRLFGGDYAPVNWNKCDGSLLPISNYETLFSLIGITYGGDGQTNFALPDLRGRLPMGQGQGPGLTNRVNAQKIGVETVTLITTQLPAHGHALVATTAAATTELPTNSVFAAQTDGDKIYVAANGNNQPAQLAATTIGLTGGSMPHDNVMPSLALTYIICLNGIYPQQN